MQTSLIRCRTKLHITMSKISRAITSLLILALLSGTWFFGSLLVIQIDSENFQKVKGLELFNKKNQELKQNVDKYCRLLDKGEIVRESLSSVKNAINPKNRKQYEDETKKAEALREWERARKEKILRENLIYFPQFQQMWCIVPKAASTSWSKAIMDKLNYENMSIFVDPNSTDSLQVILRNNFGNINKTAYIEAVKSEKVKKILLVRHPFSRLVSAYADKLVDRKAKTDSLHFYQRFGVQMNRKYRKSRKMVKQKEPTFQEFVDYLLDTKPIDYEDHWKPISLLCGLCHVHYDHIIVTEDLRETSDLYLHRLEFPKGYKLPKENSQNSSSKELFKSITNSKKVKLLQRYQDDFRLFQYSFLNHYI